MKEFQFCDRPGVGKSKVMNSYAVRGLAVQVDQADPTVFAPAEESNPSQVYFLEREVIAGTLTETVIESVLPQIGPVAETMGSVVNGRRTNDIEVEGDANLVLAGAGSLASAEAGDQIGAAAGKLQKFQDGDKRVGVISEVLTAQLSGNNIRLRIDVD